MLIFANRKLVLQKAHRYFGSDKVEEVMAILDHYTAATEAARARVQLGILKLSEGDVEKLTYWANLALSDYRDILAFAESPQEMATDPGEVGRMDGMAVRTLRERDRQQYIDWLGGSNLPTPHIHDV
jgi:hypothetical protein